jgi:DNA-directed RNA polymerase subunit beta
MLAQQAERLNFSSIINRTDYPDFLDIQIKSFQDFFQLETKSDQRENEGLYKTFMENFPITDTRNQFVLEFLDYFIDPPRYTIEECIERGLTYSVPLKARSNCIVPTLSTKILKRSYRMFIWVPYHT